MMKKKQKEPVFSSTELAAKTSLIPVWDPTVVFPSTKAMYDLDIVTHVAVERAKSKGYHYLHEASIAWHRDRFYACWANHLAKEDGDHDELIRGCTSTDALRWSEASIWAQAPLSGATSLNHPLLFSHGDKLYGFFACWNEEHIPSTELFILNDDTNEWKWQKESSIPMFVPFCSPQRMDNGNWILGGSSHWKDAAVIISDGDDFTKWEKVIITRADDFKLMYPETSIINRGNNKLLAFCRPPDRQTLTAPVSESLDGGHTWTSLSLSNFPLADSQPFGGKLSNGQNYLLTNSLESEEGRGLLSIAVTGPEGGLFRHIFKIRHQDWPAIRLFGGQGKGTAVGKTTEWSYPSVIEHNESLYIIYTQGKEDCVLSIVPIEVLSV